jgi:hypothetical protein
MSDNEPMRRSPAVEPDDWVDVYDRVADYGHDAVDAGIDADGVVQALRKAADEIEREREEDDR